MTGEATKGAMMGKGTVSETHHMLDYDSQLIRHEAGHFQGTFSERWNALGGVVNGGYSAAVCLDALGQVLAHPDPLVVSTFFVGRGTPGPVEVHTDVARVGRRMSTGTARLCQAGKEIVRTTASYADLGRSQGMTSLSNQMPDLPAPEDAVDPFEDFQLPGVTMTDQVEFRYAARPVHGRLLDPLHRCRVRPPIEAPGQVGVPSAPEAMLDDCAVREVSRQGWGLLR